MRVIDINRKSQTLVTIHLFILTLKYQNQYQYISTLHLLLMKIIAYLSDL